MTHAVRCVSSSFAPRLVRCRGVHRYGTAGIQRWVVPRALTENEKSAPSENPSPNSDPPESYASTDDEKKRQAKAALWENWWFEARNADALEVLAKMPDADLDAVTKSRIDPKAKQMWQPGGHSAVTLAAKRNDAESIKMLHEIGADLNCVDTNGAGPIHHACFANAANAVEALLKCGADCNLQDERDLSTPLILAAYGMRRDALRVLLDWNESTSNDSGSNTVDLTLRDVGNATVAGHLAQRKLGEELVRVLINCGPGGAGKLLRGEKVYLQKKQELVGQLEVLSVEQLLAVAKAWRARPKEGEDKKALIVKLLQVTP